MFHVDIDQVTIALARAAMVITSASLPLRFAE